MSACESMLDWRLYAKTNVSEKQVTAAPRLREITNRLCLQRRTHPAARKASLKKVRTLFPVSATTVVQEKPRTQLARTRK